MQVGMAHSERNSDHCPIFLLLKTGVMCKKEAKVKTYIDRKLLKQTEKAERFIAIVKAEYNIANENKTKTALQRLEGALQTAAKAVLTTDARKQPGWFEAAHVRLKPAIAARNLASADYTANKGDSAVHDTLKAARKVVRSEVRKAENAWLSNLVADINAEGIGSNGLPRSPKDIWTAIKQIRNGKSITKEVQPMMLKKADGSLCKTPEENSEVMGAYLHSTFNQAGVFDPKVIERIRQRDPAPYQWMSNAPNCKEVTAIKRLREEKSGGDAKIPAEYYKVLETDAETRTYVRMLIHSFWTTGSYTREVPMPQTPGEVPLSQTPPLASQLPRAARTEHATSSIARHTSSYCFSLTNHHQHLTNTTTTTNTNTYTTNTNTSTITTITIYTFTMGRDS